MEIKILEFSETSAKFIISDVNHQFVNALRRTLLAHVPKMAIEYVDFHIGKIRGDSENDKKVYELITPLFDEIIAHRLGMIPIPTDLDLFVLPNECKCGGEGCPSCRIIYFLHKKGPCTVYSGDLQPIDDPNFRIKEDLIPIVKLGEGQAIFLYATAILGTGKEHAKWSPVHGVGYKYYPIIEIDHKKCDRVGTCIKNCPQKILQLENDKIVVKDIERCTLCKTCVEVCSNKAISVRGDNTKFIFQFETDGALTAKQSLFYALNLLAKNYMRLRECVSESLKLCGDSLAWSKAPE